MNLAGGAGTRCAADGWLTPQLKPEGDPSPGALGAEWRAATGRSTRRGGQGGRIPQLRRWVQVALKTRPPLGCPWVFTLAASSPPHLRVG